MRTGARVTERKAAKNMAKVLVKARGLKSLPSWASRVKMGRKETVMISKEKKSGRPTSLAAWIKSSLRAMGFPSRLPFLQPCMGILHHDDGRIHHGPDGDGDSPQGHDVRTQVDVIHAHEGQQNGNG